MKKVITFGVFDYFHLGHLRLLKQAKAQGDWLTVAVQKDEAILKYKPHTRIFYSADERKEILSALRLVDEVVFYRDVDRDIQRLDFDVFAVGEDQNHEGFQRAVAWCEANGKEVVRMKRTAGFSSTEIKEKAGNLI